MLLSKRQFTEFPNTLLDNGSELLNDHLVRYFRDRAQVPLLSRSRSYQKNDNRFVEQKNRTIAETCWVTHAWIR